jgi:hypothetical protein
LKIKTTAPAAAAPATVAAPAVAVAVPSGPTATPEEVTQELSGFRKALMQTMKDLGGEQTQIQDALLDGLRKTAEEIVQQNKDIFGEKMEKTVDQSAAYEIFEKVVDLSEQAAKARTVEEKRKILQRLRTFKRVTQNVFKGGGKHGEIAKKLLDIIDKIEEPLSKETGIRAAAKEKISDYMKMLPEKMAAKIPLVGGMISRSLQRRREQKEEEAQALSTLTEEISRAGRTSLYGRRGGSEIGPTLTTPDMGMGMGTAEPPIPGGTTVAEITNTKGAKGGFDKSAVVTLKAILLNVQDIKKLLFDQYDPEDQELKAEEASREEENKRINALQKMKGLFGGKGGGAGGATTGESGGFISSILDFFGLGNLSSILGSAASTIGSLVSSLGPMLSGIATTLGGLATTVAGAVGSVVTTIGGAAAAAAPWVAAAAAGAALGLGAAWVVNKGIDAVFGTDLSDRMFDSDTWTFDDARRDAEREELGAKITAEHERQTSTPEYIQRMSEDPRMLPKLVSDKKLTGAQALESLTKYEMQHGPGEDTKAIRERILQLDPSARNEVMPVEGMNNGTVEGMDNGTVEGMDNGTVEGMDNGTVEGMDNGTVEGMDNGTVEGMNNRTVEGMNNGTVEGMNNGTVEGTRRERIWRESILQLDPSARNEVMPVEGMDNRTVEGTRRERILQLDPSARNEVMPVEGMDNGTVKGTIVPPGEKNITQQTLNTLEQSQDALAAETMGPPAPIGMNTVVAPTTNNSNTTINNNSGNSGVRNNDPTLKAAERASM